MPKVGMEPIRRRQIIEATLRQIARRGLTVMRMEDVARDCGVSKGVVAYYFGSKATVILEACRSFLEYFLQRPDGEIYDGTDADGAGFRSEVILNHILDLMFLPPPPEKRPFGLKREDLRELMMQIYAYTNRDAEFGALVRDFYRRYHDGIRDIIQLGLAEGRFAVADPEEAARVVVALLEGLMIQKLVGLPDGETPAGLRTFAGIQVFALLEKPV